MPFAQLSQVRQHYYEYGSGPERVVFVHGFQASARIWQLVQEALPADRYRTIAANNRGAGETDAPPDEDAFTIPHFASDLHELVGQLGWRDFTLVGHSLGGATVAQFAVAHPDLLKGLVLLDPTDPGGSDASAETIERLVDERVRRVLAERAQGNLDGLRPDGAHAPAEFLRLLAADIAAAPERRLRGSMRSRFQLRLGEAVGSLPLPVLLACGDADATIPLATMLQTWARYPKGTSLHVWHGVGHSPNVEIPDRVAGLLRRFIEVTIPARRAAVTTAYVGGRGTQMGTDGGQMSTDTVH